MKGKVVTPLPNATLATAIAANTRPEEVNQAMSHVAGTFTGAQGDPLYYQRWYPLEPARAVLGIVHGLGSHSGLFGNLVHTLVPQGFAVYGFDLRGHGRSPGQRGYINSWAEFREDMGQFWQLMAYHHPTTPRFVLGHSLGANIVFDYALRYPETFPGIIAMAPALGPVGVSPLRLKLGQILSRTIPRFSLDTGIPQKAGSQEEATIAAYTTDPLRHRRGTARLVTEFLQTTQWIQANLSNLTVPILILHGTADPVALPASSQALFQQIPSPDKEHREYPGAYHDLHNDTAADQVSRDIAHWLDRQVTSKVAV